MALKRNCDGSKKVAQEVSHFEGWVWSISNEVVLNNLVVHGVLPDRATVGWRPAAGEDFPIPHTNELVMFEEYF